jgi:hypothetical protein
MRFALSRAAALLLGVCLAMPLSAQVEPAPAVADAPQSASPVADRLRIFLDCQWQCDMDFLRIDIPFVDWMRERQDADVHIIVTAQGTGAGGSEYTLRFIGLRDFQGMTDEMKFTSPPNTAQAATRQSMSRVLKGGLVRYAMRTEVGERLQVGLTQAAARPAGGAAPGAGARDPWNGWVLRTSVGGYMFNESSYKSRNMNASVSANRTTLGWKTVLSASTRSNRTDIAIGDRWVPNEQRDHNASTLTVRSLNEHWSAGGRSNVSHSTFTNRDVAMRVAPAIEYNFFPYSESTRRQLTLQYSVGGNQISYLQETIYGKVEETLLDHTANLGYSLRTTWGQLGGSLEGTQYFHDASKYNLRMGGNVQLRLFRGLALNASGSGERIRDQLHLARGNLTSEQILLRQRQIATNHRYNGSVNLSYSFGSIFTSAVNPRMGGGGNQGTVIFF